MPHFLYVDSASYETLFYLLGSCQALKENNPTSGLSRFMVARGGIEPGPKMLNTNLITS